MDLLTTVAFIALTGSGLFFVLGRRPLAKQFFAFAIALALICPVLACLRLELSPPTRPLLLVFLAVAVVVLAFAGWARYRTRKKQLDALVENKPISQKRRVEGGQ